MSNFYIIKKLYIKINLKALEINILREFIKLTPKNF